jgi:hypothetical protein
MARRWEVEIGNLSEKPGFPKKADIIFKENAACVESAIRNFVWIARP